MMQFSLVSTVYNEIGRLSATISDLENQSLKPSEIIITDAGSDDGTFEELVRWSRRSPIKIIVLKKTGCNVAEGRNLAIKHSSCEIVASTDFGCRFHRDWLLTLINPFNDPEVRVVGGNFTVLKDEMKSWVERGAYICANGYKYIMDNTFLPSSRSIAYYKSIWQDVGGYPEELTLAGDDTTFALRLKQKGYSITLTEKPYVYWLRPTSLKGYLKEAKRYAIGDAESRDHKNLRNVIVNSTELVLRAAFITIFLALVTGLLNPGIVTISLLFFCLPGFRSFFRIIRQWYRVRSDSYGITDLVYAFVFFDISRINYIYWYIVTVLKEPRGRLTKMGTTLHII